MVTFTATKPTKRFSKCQCISRDLQRITLLSIYPARAFNNVGVRMHNQISEPSSQFTLIRTSISLISSYTCYDYELSFNVD